MMRLTMNDIPSDDPRKPGALLPVAFDPARAKNLRRVKRNRQETCI